MKDVPIIKCPVCGMEYMPSEVFIPNSFFGKQKDIFRSVDGQIEFYDGDDPELTETFTCEHCGTNLSIEAKLTFKVDELKDDFDEEYVTKIDKPNKIILDEETLF